jgi:hypothetical protein
MCMAVNDPWRQAEKLRQRIVASSAKGAQVVFITPRGQVDCCTVGSERHQAMASRPDFFARVAGVFDAQVTAELLAASLREVA